MNTQLYSVSKIFTERILRIPDYQRGYAWTEKQLKDFWSDLNQLDDDKNHYIGVLTLEDVPEDTVKQWGEDHWIIYSKSHVPYYVVDGQQRLTTTIILIQAICEVVNRLEDTPQLNYTSVEDIRKKFIYDSKDKGISRSYIFGYEKDNPSYEFLKTQIFLDSSDNAFPIQETIYTHNLERAKDYFQKRVSELQLHEIERIYKKITQNFLFNIYSISEDIDVYVAFETMNNRGKPLSHLELLKNRLIYLSTKFETDDYEKIQLRHSINEAWKSVYHYLGKNKNNPLDDDRFLYNHFILYFTDDLSKGEASHYRRIRRHYLYGSDFYKDYLLESVFTTKNIRATDGVEGSLTISEIYKYVKSLKSSVETWYHLLNPGQSSFTTEVKHQLEKLNRIGMLPFAPLTMVFFQNVKDSKSRVRLLTSLERLAFIYSLLGVRFPIHFDLDPVDNVELAVEVSKGAIHSDDVVKKINQTADEIVSFSRQLSQIRQEFSKRGFYKWEGVRYFLFEYEMYLKSKSKTYRHKLDWDILSDDKRDHKTIEHIYPQRARKDCWTEKFSHYSPDQRRALKHSLGNLVPLSKPKNSSFQNKCFEDKKGKGSSMIGFKYGSLSENEVADFEKWTAVEILQRGLKLLNFMEDRWGIKLGKLEDKAKMLGLEFVPKKEGIKLASLVQSDKKRR